MNSENSTDASNAAANSPASQEMLAKAQQRLADGSAWEDFCDTLKVAGRVVQREVPDGNERDLVEGYRYLVRVLLHSAANYIERVVPSAPTKLRINPPPLKGGIGIQSPNQDHGFLQVDPRYKFKVTGQRGSVPYVHMAAWSPPVPQDAGSFATGLGAEELLEDFNPVANRASFEASLDDYVIDDEGNVEFVICTEELAGEEQRRFPIVADTHEIFIRAVYDDRSTQRPPKLQIERLPDEEGKVISEPEPPLPADMSKRLAMGGQYVLGNIISFSALRNIMATNEFPPQPGDGTQLGGASDRHYSACQWKLEDDEALVVEFNPTGCQHWNFQLCNHWLENLPNYLAGAGYAAQETATPEPDGTVRLIIAQENPNNATPSSAAPSNEIPAKPLNWINPAGYNHGVLTLRIILPQTPPNATIRLVKLNELQ